MIEQFFRELLKNFTKKEMSLADCLLTLERQGVDTKSASGIFMFIQISEWRMTTRTINAMVFH